MSNERARHGGRETGVDWLAALLAVVLGGIHVYIGVVDDELQFFVVAALFLLGLLFFFTGLWRAVLYLLAAVYVATLGVLWLLGGMEYRGIGLLTGAISISFIGLAVYLFLEESKTFG